MEVTVAIIAGLFSISVSLLGTIFLNLSNTKLQTRKLKEEHYVRYMEALHNLAVDNNDSEALKEYTLHRDKIFIVANEKVVKAILKYEAEGVGKNSNKHDDYLTNIVKEIRKDLNIRDKNYPQINLKKSNQ